MSDKQNDANQTPSAAKKTYATPRVVSYGHVKDIIQGGGGKKSDATGTPPGGNSRSCWIAEALYGEDDARTLLLRAWLAVVYDERRPGWQFIVLYSTFGRPTANLIRRGLIPGALFRPLFDALVRKALDERALALAAVRG